MKKYAKLVKLVPTQKLLVSITAIILLLATGIGSVLAFDYYSAKKLEREGDSLVEAEKYSEAVERYSNSSSKWFSQKSKIRQKISQAKELETVLTNFQKCQEFYEDKDYQNAISRCKSVPENSKYSQNAYEIFLKASGQKILDDLDRQRAIQNPSAYSSNNRSKSIDEIRQKQEYIMQAWERKEKFVGDLIAAQKKCVSDATGMGDLYAIQKCYEFTKKPIEDGVKELDEFKKQYDELERLRLQIQAGG